MKLIGLLAVVGAINQRGILDRAIATIKLEEKMNNVAEHAQKKEELSPEQMRQQCLQK